MVDHSKAVLNSPFGRMKHLLVLMLLLFFIPFNTHAKGKGKAKIKLRTNPNQIEDVWTVSNELNYYHEPNQPYQNTLYENITLDYSASNGWDFQLASYNIPVVGGGAQNYQADTYFNISKTFIISQDFQAVLGTQSGTTLLHSANSRQLHNADYALVVYQPSRQVNLHAGSYWVNKSLSTTTDYLGYTGGFNIEVLDNLLTLQADYFSGNNNLSGAVFNTWIRVHPKAQVYFGVGVPETNSGNEFYGTVGFSVAGTSG